MDPLHAFILGLIVSIVLAPFAIRVCKPLGLIDRPSLRKKHQGQIPLAGGMLLLSALLAFAVFANSISASALAILLISPILFLLGAADDRSEISAKRRLLIQAGLGLILALVLGIRVVSLDGVFTGGPLILGFGISVLFSVACFCGVLNAANMADGMDGLLGAFAVISLIGLALLFVVTGNTVDLGLLMVLLGALAGYLAFNLGVFGLNNKIFLGDSGSLVIGLALFVLLVASAAPDSNTISPTSAGWLLGVPLMDTVSVTIRRIMQGRSPFMAGRDHLHHLLLDMKFSRISALGTLVMLHLSLVGVGVYANFSSVSQAVFFWAFVAITVLVTVLSALVHRHSVLQDQNEPVLLGNNISPVHVVSEPGAVSAIEEVEVEVTDSLRPQKLLSSNSSVAAKSRSIEVA